MRNILLILLFFASFGFSDQLSAQAILRADTVTANCERNRLILVPIKVQNFNNIGSFQFTLKWNRTDLEFVGVRNFNPDFLVGSVNIGFDTSALFINQGQMTFSWTRFGGATFTGTPTVFNVGFFLRSGGFSPVTFANSPIVIEVTDRAGNEVQTQVISAGIRAVDREVPTITCPASVTRQVPAPSPISGLTPTTGDDCGIKTLSWTASGATTVASTTASINNQVFNIGTTTVNYTAEDFAGKTTSCSFSVNLSLGGGTDVTVVAGGGSASCGEKLCVPISARNFTAMGSVQFSLKWDQRLLRYDSVTAFNPTLLLAPANFGTTRTNNGELTFNWTTDLASVGTTLPNDAVMYRICFTVLGGRATPAALAFTDSPSVREANRARPLVEVPMVTINAELNLTDNTPPTITCPANRSVAAAAGEVTAVLNDLNATATDNCGGTPTITYTRTGTTPGSGTGSANGTYNAGTTTITYRAADLAGNSTSCSFTVNVRADGVLQVYLDTAAVACNAPSNQLTFNVRVRNFSNLLGLQFSLKWDTSALEFVSPVTNVFNGLNLSSASFLGYSTTPNGTLQFLGGNGTMGWPNIPNGGILYSLTFRVKKPNATVPIVFAEPFDAVNTAFQSVNFLRSPGALRASDITPPTLSNCPQNISVSSGSTTCTANVPLSLPTAADDCSGVDGAVRSNAPAGNAFNPGSTVVVFTATDRAGNSSTCSTTVTVRENVPPVFSACPNSLSVNLPGNKCDTLVTWTAPTVTDNCGTPTQQSNFQPGARFPAGRTLVIYTATDAAGNSASCSFTVSAVDQVKPVISGCPRDSVINNATNCGILINWRVPTATDNCDPNPRVTTSRMPRDTFFAGVTNVIILAQDASSNFDTCRFRVTINTSVNQGFTNIPQSQTFTLTDACVRRVSWEQPQPVGFCRTPTLRSNFEPNAEFPAGTTTVIYTATDQSGQSTSATFNITIRETTAPVFSNCPRPVRVNVGGVIVSDSSRIVAAADTAAACRSARVTLRDLAATDNCGTPTIRQVNGPTDGIYPTGANTVTFVATDQAGNSATCSFLVEVIALDRLRPTVSPVPACEGSQVVLDAPTIPGANYTWTGPQRDYPNAPRITVLSLSPGNAGIYTVFAEVKGCRSVRDSVRVILAGKPNAVDDARLQFMINAIDSFNVLTNDTFALLSDIVLTQKTQADGVRYLSNGRFVFDAGATGKEVSFTYEICSRTCPTQCDMATVTLRVIDSRCDFIPNVISPNGDFVNDILVVPCLESGQYPNSSMMIYNKWGDVVYKAQPYSNDSNVAWQGTLNNESGRDLPDGVYYYIFLPAPDQPAIKGFVQIMR
jgi:large repetitive protein